MMWVWISLSTLLILAGLAGIIVPGLPDTILVFAGILVYAIATGYAKISLTILIILAILTILTNVADYLGTIYGAKKLGASKYGIIGTIVGGIIGLILFSVIGFVIGAIAGTILAEIYLAKKDVKKATRAGVGTLLGLIGSLIFKILVVITMLMIFVWKLFWP